MYLAVHGQGHQPTSLIAKTFNISEHHLSKVATALVRGGFITSGRGRLGGLQLERPAEHINIGSVVRHLLGDIPVAQDCSPSPTKGCKINPACGLRAPLKKAQQAFLSTLDQYNLKDVTKHEQHLRKLLVF